MGNYVQAILGKYSLSHFIKEQAKTKNEWPYPRRLSTLARFPGQLDGTPGPLQLKEDDSARHTDSLTELTKGAKDNLLSVHTVFPFVWFADTLKIDRQKLTIVHNDLFRTSHTASIRLKDLGNVQADIGPLFGSITLTSRHFQNNTQTIKFLRRKDITEAQRLLQGFMIAHEAQIDTDNIEHDKLKALLNRLGRENT